MTRLNLIVEISQTISSKESYFRITTEGGAVIRDGYLQNTKPETRTLIADALKMIAASKEFA
jgi:hypothetical protein